MSTSAYRIENEIINGRVWSSAVSVPTFNYSNDVEVRNFLVNRAVNHGDDGSFTIHIETLEELFSEVEAGNINPTIDVLSRLRQDLECAEEEQSLAIDYEVF